jgi:hypothetical protein
MKYSSFIMAMYLETTKRRRKMEMILGGVAFAVLFAGWVVVPTIIKNRHTKKAEEESR